MKHFKINDVSLPYAREAFNEAWKNERSVEVSLGRWFLDKFNGNVLEVGAVMPYYGHSEHEIIDLADEHPKSKKINALSFDYTGRNVLCISTIEHMMTKEYNNGSDQDSINFLNMVISQADNYMITFGISYNPFLDDYLKRNTTVPRLILKRINWKNEYVKHYANNDFSFPFGHSDRPIPQGYFNNANGLCIVTNLKELL